MGVINYSGNLSVACVLQWTGESIANPLSTDRANHRFIIANESVTAFTMRFDANGTPVTIARQSTRSRRYFDDRLNTYTTAPVSGANLDALIDAGTPTGTIDLTFTYRPFFDTLIEQMTRTDSDLHNLANPNDSAAILNTFTHRVSGRRVRITYQDATQQIVALPCRLVDKEVTPRSGRRPPAVKLIFELDFMTGIDATRREAMRKLIAMDWSKLARYGNYNEVGDAREFVKVWYWNVYSHLANQTDPDRGERFRQAIFNRQKTKDAATLSTDLRNDIDLHIVTANHWGEAREDMTTERHQRFLSDLFGTLHQSAWLASPVCYIREFGSAFSLTLTQQAGLILQYGAGHCGEHSQVSYSLLCDIIDEPGSQITTAIWTGNANIDHAFAIYDLTVSTVIVTTTTASNNTRMGGAGKDIRVWNLRDAIADSDPMVGYVMDPYLDPSVMRPTAQELLTALNSRRRRDSHKDTDFLAFVDNHPSGGYTTEDIRGESAAVRRSRVRHV